MLPDGTALVLWARRTGQEGEQPVAAARPPGAGWVSGVGLLGSTGGLVVDAASAPDGRAAVALYNFASVWVVGRPHGGPWTAPELLTPPGEFQHDPSIALSRAGETIVAFRSGRPKMALRGPGDAGWTLADLAPSDLAPPRLSRARAVSAARPLPGCGARVATVVVRLSAPARLRVRLTAANGLRVGQVEADLQAGASAVPVPRCPAGRRPLAAGVLGVEVTAANASGPGETRSVKVRVRTTAGPTSQ